MCIVSKNYGIVFVKSFLFLSPDPAGLRRLSLPHPSCPLLPPQPTLQPTLPPRPSSPGSPLSEKSSILCLKHGPSFCRTPISLSLGGKATIFHTGRLDEWFLVESNDYWFAVSLWCQTDNTHQSHCRWHHIFLKLYWLPYQSPCC